MEKRPIYLLYRDKSVEISYKPLRKLIQKRALGGVTWVLIPISHTSATYIAVSGDVLSTQFRQFHSASVRFHMQYCNDMGPTSEQADEKAVVLWDYETVTLEAMSLEELYNALYQPFIFAYLRSLCQFSDRDIDFWFIHVKDIEVIMYDARGEVIDDFIASADVHIGTIPFPYDEDALIVDDIAAHFGLSVAGQPRYRWNLVIEQKGPGLSWRESKGHIIMYSYVKYVGVSSGSYCSYVMLNDKEYCAILRVNTAVNYLSPLAIETTTPREIRKILPISTYFNVPKYSFGMSYESEYEVLVEPIFTQYAMYLCYTGYIDLMDADDIAVYLDHSYYLMQMLTEGTRVQIAINKDAESLKDFQFTGTTLFECHLEIDIDQEPTMQEKYRDLSIFSDSWQDYPPTAREVCYLIQLAEKEK